MMGSVSRRCRNTIPTSPVSPDRITCAVFGFSVQDDGSRVKEDAPAPTCSREHAPFPTTLCGYASHSLGGGETRFAFSAKACSPRAYDPRSGSCLPARHARSPNRSLSTLSLSLSISPTSPFEHTQAAPVHRFCDHSAEIYTIRWSPTGPGTARQAETRECAHSRDTRETRLSPDHERAQDPSCCRRLQHTRRRRRPTRRRGWRRPRSTRTVSVSTHGDRLSKST